MVKKWIARRGAITLVRRDGNAMGRHIIEKTGNVAAVQRQLDHRNAIYSITAEELGAVLEER